MGTVDPISEVAVEIPVLIEALPGDQGFEARAGEPFAVTVRAATEHEALTRLERAVHDRLTGQTRVVTLALNVPPPVVPSGFLPDVAFTRGWMEAVAEERRQQNAEPDPWELSPEGQSAMAMPGPTVKGSMAGPKPG